MGNNFQMKQLSHFWCTLVLTAVLVAQWSVAMAEIDLKNEISDPTSSPSDEIRDYTQIDHGQSHSHGESHGHTHNFDDSESEVSQMDPFANQSQNPYVAVAGEKGEIIVSCNDAGQPIYERNINDCNSYFVCTGFYYVLFRCPADLHWNPNTASCDWPQNAKCLEAEVTVEKSGDRK